METGRISPSNNTTTGSNDNSDGSLGGRAVATALSTQHQGLVSFIQTQKDLFKVTRSYLTKRDITNLRLTCKPISEAVNQYIERCECESLHFSYSNPFSRYPNLRHIKVQSMSYSPIEVLRQPVESRPNPPLELPPSLQSFECEGMCCPLDTTKCSNLKTVKVQGFWGSGSDWKLPPAIENFKCGNITGITIDLSSYSQLQEVEIGNLTKAETRNIYGKIIAPPNLTTFKTWGIEEKTYIDFRHCTQPLKVSLGNVAANINLPASLIEFECGFVREGVILDFSKCTGSVFIKFRDSMLGKFIPPVNLHHFKCRTVCKGVEIDLSGCTGLSSVDIDYNEGNLILPPHLQSQVGSLELGKPVKIGLK